MEDYPRTLSELEARFSTDKACREYIAMLRWPDGFICPRCGGRKVWTRKDQRMLCSDCRYKMSVTAGTIFQDSHMPLTTWFRAIWWVTSQKTGTSALGLQRILGIKSYKTAWAMLHKLRRAMVRPGRDRLSGRVEVDEAYWGSPEEGLLGREHEEKAIIAVAAEEDGNGIGRIRMRRIEDVSRESLHAFIAECIQPGSLVHTDGWLAYRGIETLGYKHKVTVIMKKKETAAELMPRVHRVVSLMKRWLMGTHQGAVSHEHLDYYLDEFTFRFNRRTSRSRGKLFYRLLQHAVVVDPVPYSLLIKHVRGDKTR